MDRLASSLRAPRRRSLAALGGLLLPLGVACSTVGRGVGEVDALIRNEEFHTALTRASELHADNPDDEEVAREYRRATVAWLLDRGREATFADRDEEALGLFEEALAIAPGNVVVRDWIDKTERELCDRWLDKALDLEGQGQFAAASDAFEAALGYVPDDSQAIAGAARILLIQNYRRGLGQAYYEDGVRRLREALLLQARQNFAYTTKYLPHDDRAVDRQQKVRRQLAGERLEVAKHFEAEKLFPAARTEYRIVMVLDPGNPEAEEGLARAEREGRALAKLELADMLVRKNRLDDAREALREGLEMTELQFDEFQRKGVDIEEDAIRKLYERALDSESDYRFEEAVEIYDEILSRAEYFADVIARKETLQEYMQLAAVLYDKVLAAEDDEAELDLLLQLEVFWPEYRDVAERLQRLEPERR